MKANIRATQDYNPVEFLESNLTLNENNYIIVLGDDCQEEPQSQVSEVEEYQEPNSH